MIVSLAAIVFGGTILAGPAIAAEALSGPIHAEVVSVYNGDTFTARARVWPGHTVETKVRIVGLDTPEKGGRSRCPAEAEAAAPYATATPS